MEGKIIFPKIDLKKIKPGDQVVVFHQGAPRPAEVIKINHNKALVKYRSHLSGDTIEKYFDSVYSLYTAIFNKTHQSEHSTS